MLKLKYFTNMNNNNMYKLFTILLLKFLHDRKYIFFIFGELEVFEFQRTFDYFEMKNGYFSTL